MPAEYCSVIVQTFLIWSGKKVEEWLLVSLIYSLSLLYLIQMKMQLLFFRRKRIFLKKEAGFDIIGAHFNFA